MADDRVYIILVNYNGWRDTIECLDSLMELDYPNYKVVIVDNHSSDKSIAHIIDWAVGKASPGLRYSRPLQSARSQGIGTTLPYIFYTHDEAKCSGNLSKERDCGPMDLSYCGIDHALPIIIIQTDRNLGFAGGNNVGMCYALTKDDGQYIWLLNNDTVVRKDTLTNLVLKMNESEQTGAVGSVLMSYSRPNRLQTLGGHVLHKYLGFTNRIATDPNKTGIDFISGCSILVRRDVINRVGLLDSEYFIYWEDADWCERIRRQGYFLTYAPQSIVYHKEGQSSTTRTSSYFSTFNCFQFYRKYYRAALPVVLVNRFFIILLITVRNKRLSYLNGALHAYCDFLKRLL